MSVTEYQCVENEKLVARFRVYVCVRSKLSRKVKLQRTREGIETAKEAEKVEKQMLLDLRLELFKLESHGPGWGQLVEKWKAAMIKGDVKSSNGVSIGLDTRLDYIRCVEIYTSDWSKRPLEDITSGDVKQVLLDVERRDNGNSRKIKVVTAIKCVFAWATDFGHLKRNIIWPTHAIKISRKDSKIPGILSLKQIKVFLESAKFHDHPWYPIWALALQTGMRSGELRALEWNDVDFETQKISVTKSFKNTELKSTKGGYWRIVPFNDDTAALLRDIRAKRGAEKQVLPRFNEWNQGEQAKVLRVFLGSMGLPQVTFHNLRACWATQMLNNRVPSTVIMRIGGWMDLKAFQRYVRLAGVEIEGATNALDFLPKQEAFSNIRSLNG